jgi:membrane protein YqaA with SNARE-associated domain
MTRTTPDPSLRASAASGAAPLTGAELVWPVLRLLAGLVLMLLVVGTLAHLARPQCEAAARGFVSAYGYWGMALGTLLADGFHFPIPPQFYMLLSIASRASAPVSLLVIVAASLLAGVVGYTMARFVANNAWVAARTERSRRLLERAVLRFGAQAALIASLLPIPYSLLCYLAGLNRMPRRFLVLVCLCRIPKLILFYLLVHWGWQQA